MGQSPADQTDAPPDDPAGDLTYVSQTPNDDIDYENSVVVGEFKSIIGNATARGKYWKSIRGDCGHYCWLQVGKGLVFWAYGAKLLCDNCAFALGISQYDPS